MQDGIPNDLKKVNQWVLWRYETKGNGKPTKIPCRASGSNASSTDKTHWCSYDEAVKAHESSHTKTSGIGFVFTADDVFFGIDLDNCIDENGVIASWASDILRDVKSYTEISPSGKGLKIFCKGKPSLTSGKKTKVNDDGGGIEIYERGRYFTVTGEHYTGTPSDVCSVDITAVYERFFGKKTKKKTTKTNTNTTTDHYQIIDRARKYMAAYPPAVSGQSGHDVTFRLACVLCSGFALDFSDALAILESWNLRCDPPWSDKELEHKINQAMKAKAGEDVGYMLRNDDGYETQKNTGTRVDFAKEDTGKISVDISAITQRIGQRNSTSFPDDLLSVPGFISEFTDWVLTQSSRPNPIIALAAGVSLQGHMIGRKVRDKSGNRSNLYMALLAPSGAGKQAPQDCIKKLLAITDQQHAYGGKVASDSALADALMEHPAKLFIWDEFGRFLDKMKEKKGGTHMQAVQEVLLELWNATSILWKHKALADRRNNREINQPCASFFGLTVADSFWSGLEQQHMTDGFAARILVIDAGKQKPKRNDDKEELPPPQSLIETAMFWKNFQPGGGDLSGVNPMPQVIPETDRAKAIFRDLLDQQDAHTQEPAASVWSRAIEKAKRLAMIYACSADREAPVIDTAAASWGCRFAAYTTRSFLSSAAQEITPDDIFHAAKKRVQDAIRKQTAIGHAATRSYILRTAGVRAQMRDEVIAHLLECGDIVESERENSRGRVVQMWHTV